ncbi:hypothetical protein DPMN_059987 [Dreissena polymorpha]|uniref:Uncharacterized protein n=1 Tax=Dreissena polymorpha TaxID=45954 RepID=A0A9D4C4E1_DREPO|nr:hypothetical protein DPMN_059987 [Dreissena polymorpha]
MRKTGRHGYRTKDYDIIPAEGEVFVTEDERICIYRGDRTKKMKCNTPFKEGQLSEIVENVANVDGIEIEGQSSEIEK